MTWWIVAALKVWAISVAVIFGLLCLARATGARQPQGTDVVWTLNAVALAILMPITGTMIPLALLVQWLLESLFVPDRACPECGHRK